MASANPVVRVILVTLPGPPEASEVAVGAAAAASGETRTNSLTCCSNGKDVVNLSDIQDPRMQRMANRMAEQMGVTNGQITRQQFVTYQEQRAAGGGGRGNSPSGAPGGPGGTGAPFDRGGFRGRGGNPDATAEGMFQRLDQNGDGYLNFDEMPPQLRSEVDQWDKDRNRLIDLTEFRAYYEAQRAAALRQSGECEPIRAGQLAKLHH